MAAQQYRIRIVENTSTEGIVRCFIVHREVSRVVRVVEKGVPGGMSRMLCIVGLLAT